MADALGKLYNKDALLEFLLAPPPSAENPVSSRPFGADGLLAAGHLRSLKDVHPLRLTPASSSGAQSIASASNADSGGQVEYGKAVYECPITLRGMNGSTKFVYIRGCGCVASEVGLREVAGIKDGQAPSSDGKGKAKAADGDDGAEKKQGAVCPVCGEMLPTDKVEMVTLNPVGEEKEAMTRAWEEKVAKDEKEKAEKKAAKQAKKKRKGGAADEDEEAEQKKKQKANGEAAAHAQLAPSTSRKLPSVPEAKKPVSAAIASLYKKDDTKTLSPLFSSGYSRF